MSQPTIRGASTNKGAKDKAKESYFDEFLSLLPGSSQNKKVSDEVFIDDLGFCRDVRTSDISGMCLFRYFYKNADSLVPVSNPWTSGLEKLIVSDVFLDVDLLVELANNYDPLSKTIRKVDGLALVTLDRNSFMKAFRIFFPMATKINLQA